MILHNRSLQRDEHAFTGLELVILLTVIIGILIILVLFMSGGEVPAGVRTFPGGLVAESMYISGDHLQPVGSVFGFPALSGTRDNENVVFLHPDPGKLGVVRMMVSLFIGDTGAIDMDRTNVRWTSQKPNELIHKTDLSFLVCPNWTISGKYNMLPGHIADADNLLEPNEAFEILLCPSTGVQPYGSLSFTISPEGTAMPLTITRTVPPGILPVMNLG